MRLIRKKKPSAVLQFRILSVSLALLLLTAWLSLLGIASLLLSMIIFFFLAKYFISPSNAIAVSLLCCGLSSSVPTSVSFSFSHEPPSSRLSLIFSTSLRSQDQWQIC
ncbi:Uncharacterized protein TCM_025925 [Theobroma cacao]|uniref:Uncharacterized protein n=1 Tax=Theobroma cacao TaxID=3641 RepID=A0A061F105_THECC|nr:Uncharacterized protein TCM_025925 [Theobroma cacao]